MKFKDFNEPGILLYESLNLKSFDFLFGNFFYLNL